ncbi:hypothetical protein EXIGLDRAFT_840582 [Exidia glandulosa HHB12029]|uniref:SHSP domain-containing protein n=1 Tax=Exidia glandulosa HHB12029 TaxID=1314781 RepID=A0A165ED42_EXIGL|nr:hypothetical protein EXIGLDRAFT_840582 [Exidia glandulosa HHB12029]
MLSPAVISFPPPASCASLTPMDAFPEFRTASKVDAKDAFPEFRPRPQAVGGEDAFREFRTTAPTLYYGDAFREFRPSQSARDSFGEFRTQTAATTTRDEFAEFRSPEWHMPAAFKRIFHRQQRASPSSAVTIEDVPQTEDLLVTVPLPDTASPADVHVHLHSSSVVVDAPSLSALRSIDLPSAVLPNAYAAVKDGKLSITLHKCSTPVDSGVHMIAVH